MTAPAPPAREATRESRAPACGLVALGDSITAAEGEPMLNVPMRSWAYWLAMALDLPYTSYALPGAVAPSLRAGQLPRVRDGHALATLYVGVNDARDVGWDADAYAADVDAVLRALAVRAERLLVCTLPLDLGRPSAAPKPAQANGILRRAARAHGAVVADLAAFGGWTHVLPDVVHPTALGQVAIADVAARALGADVLPSSLVHPSHPRRYASRHARALGRDLRRRAIERVRHRRSR